MGGPQAAALEVVNVSPEQLGQLGLESSFCHLPAGWPLTHRLLGPSETQFPNWSYRGYIYCYRN